jgi:hypothetical protein
VARLNGVTIISEGVPTDLATYRLSGTESYRMQNTQAQTVSGLLPNFLFSYVKVNPEQNAVVVTAPSQMLAKIGRDLAKVDLPSPQIVLEAVAVEFSDNTDLDLGLTIKDQQRTYGGSLDTNAGTISYTTIGKLPRNFEATLRALELRGKARVRARPQMAAVNGRTANIFIGAQRFILTQFNSFGQTQTRIQPVDVGVKLAVTPLTGGNNEITVRIAPEVSNITELDLQSGLPVLSTRSADTTVRVTDGETIAIGGLTLNQEQQTNRKSRCSATCPSWAACSAPKAATSFRPNWSCSSRRASCPRPPPPPQQQQQWVQQRGQCGSGAACRPARLQQHTGRSRRPMSGKKAVLVVLITGALIVLGLIATAFYLRKNLPRREWSKRVRPQSYVTTSTRCASARFGTSRLACRSRITASARRPRRDVVLGQGAGERRGEVDDGHARPVAGEQGHQRRANLAADVGRVPNK